MTYYSFSNKEALFLHLTLKGLPLGLVLALVLLERVSMRIRFGILILRLLCNILGGHLVCELVVGGLWYQYSYSDS